METYDPFRSPIPHEWLALSEFERIDLVVEFHEEEGDFGESLRLHASLHTVVENQLALGQPDAVRAALARLMRDGLDRHEAIHAIGTVLTEFLFPILKAADDPPDFDAAGYDQALRSVSPASWRGEE